MHVQLSAGPARFAAKAAGRREQKGGGLSFAPTSRTDEDRLWYGPRIYSFVGWKAAFTYPLKILRFWRITKSSDVFSIQNRIPAAYMRIGLICKI
jgi:hypothetical protein